MGALAAVLAATVIVLSPQLGRVIGAHTSDHEQINLNQLEQRSIMYDRNGKQIAVLQRENRSPVKLADMSPNVVGAVLAVEDADFYQHKGVNLRSIFRALQSNVDAGGVSQGGSTITQQVVKNSVVGNERTLSRKLREAFLATQLERQMTKNQILERYLNSAYFGHNAYGVQAAAQTYFNIDAKQLDPAQGSMLASLISNPTDNDPVAHPAKALKQRGLALDRMVETHRLTQAAADLYKLVPLPTVVQQPVAVEGYFVQDVVNRLLDNTALGSTPSARYNAVYRGGLRIYTTYDPDAQAKAEQARNQTMPGNKGDGTFDVTDPVSGRPYSGTAAVASIEPGTGAVRVLVGGVNPSAPDGYNLADNSRGRQGGSSFKTFVLGEGIEKGAVPADTVDGTSPCGDVPGYPKNKPPTNYGGEGGFVGTLTQQTQQSSNCAFLRLGQIFGIGDSISLARKLGVTSTKLDDVPSAALGTNNVTPFDMAAAYSVFANDGVRNPPYLVERIEDTTGKIVFQHAATPQRIVSVQTARLVTQVLVANVAAGTGTKAQFPDGQQAAGKTGTTTSATDLWFVGYTPQMATAVWMGVPDGTIALSFGGGDATGGEYAASTWGVYMQSLLNGVPPVDFAGPDPTRDGHYLTMGSQDNGLTPNPPPPDNPRGSSTSTGGANNQGTDPAQSTDSSAPPNGGN